VLDQLLLLLEKQGLWRVRILAYTSSLSVIQIATILLVSSFTKHVFGFAHGQNCVSGFGLRCFQGFDPHIAANDWILIVWLLVSDDLGNSLLGVGDILVFQGELVFHLHPVFGLNLVFALDLFFFILI
jgi:hypothetical protein